MRAPGANFFDSNVSGLYALGNITVVATDSLGARSTQTIIGATTSSLLGFSSTGSMSSLVVTSLQPASGCLWPSVDNLTLAAAAVPEPASIALLLAGLGVVTVASRRRRG